MSRRGLRGIVASVRQRLGGVAGTMIGMGGVAVASQGLVLAASPLLTRLYTSDDFGLLGLFLALVTILSALPTLGMHEAIVAPREERQADALFLATFISALAVGVIVTAAGISMIRGGVLGFGELPAWTIWVVYPAIVAIALAMLFQVWLARVHDWATLRAMVIGQAVLRVGIQLTAGLFGAGFAGLLAGEVLMRIAVVVLAWFRSLAELGDRIRQLDRRFVWQTVKRYRRFPIYRTPSNFLNNLGAMIVVPLVVQTFGLAAGGLYTLMELALNAPLGLANKAVGDVFLGHMSRRFSDRAAARRLLGTTVVVLLAISALPGLLLYFYGSAMFAWVFGEEWQKAGELASIMAPVLVIRFVVGPVSGTLNVANRPEFKLAFDVLALAAILASFAAANLMELSFETTISVLAVLLGSAYLFHGATIYWAMQRPREV